jgi:hypothetical protein
MLAKAVMTGPEGNAMLTAEARVETNRASRYLTQACQHFSKRVRHMAAAGRDMGVAPEQARLAAQARIEWTDTEGTVQFPWGGCRLQASPTALTLRAEAADQDKLRRLQEMISSHLLRFSRRDDLTVVWRPVETSGGSDSAAAPGTH